MNKNSGMSSIGDSLKEVMKLLRRKDKVEIKAITTTEYQVVNGRGDILVADCPIARLNDDKRCIITICPFNWRSCCEEVDPPGKYDDFRPQGVD